MSRPGLVALKLLPIQIRNNVNQPAIEIYIFLFTCCPPSLTPLPPPPPAPPWFIQLRKLPPCCEDPGWLFGPPELPPNPWKVQKCISLCPKILRRRGHLPDPGFDSGDCQTDDPELRQRRIGLGSPETRCCSIRLLKAKRVEISV